MALLVKNATLLSGKKADMLVVENRIEKIAPSLSVSAEERLDASGKLLIPGLINTHTHAAMSLLKGAAEDMELGKWLSTVRKMEERISPSQIYAGSALAALEMLKSGTTCFNDMYFHMDEVAKAVKQSGMRAALGYSMVDMADSGKRKSELSICGSFLQEWHGKANGRITCAIAPHSIYLCSPELLQKSEELSKKHGIPLHIHLSETRKEVFDCLEKNKLRPAYYLDSLGILSSRTIAAHCVWLTKEEVRLLAQRKVSASLCPVSNMKLSGGGTAPMPEMQEFGMNISLGTDGSASNNSLSMLETMKVLGLLQKNMRWDATVAKDSAIFEAATAGGAHALGVEAGELKEGKLADFALLNLKAANMAPAHSLVANAIYSAHAGNVTDTIIDGRIVMQNRLVLTMDEEKVVDSAQKQAEKLAG